MEGLASRTEVWYPISGGVEEKVVKGAFLRTLNQRPPVDCALRVEHSNLPLARSTSKSGEPSLKLEERTEGLWAIATLNPRDPEVQSLRAKAEHTDLQMSFAFRCDRDRYNEDYTRREILEVNLARGDVAICCFGASETTELSISERSDTTIAERRSFAERLSGRVAGPQLGWRASSTTCEQCGGALGCPNCEPDGTYPTPITSVSTDGRSVVGSVRLTDFRRKALALSPSAFPSDPERFLRKQIAAEDRRREMADLARRKRLTDDWASQLGMRR
jgi:HK97 family phage prohead protease